MNPEPLPILENGDHLDRAEFEKRYHAMPYLKKAELINGVVYMPSPVRYYRHARPHSLIMGWLLTYEAGTLGVAVADNCTVRLDDYNEPQPDAVLRIMEQCGGQSAISADDYIEGAPELVVEIASSSVSYDLHDKKAVYAQHGVKEYLVWQVLDEVVQWFSLQDGIYQPLSPSAEGSISSRIFVGLSLDIQALLRGDTRQVLQSLQRSMQTPEHQAFVQKLQQAYP
jgi:Uma2 family endonuclease